MSTIEPMRALLTIGDLANLLGVSIHRLKYAIEQYKIEPTRRVGIIRVWSEDKVPLIENALARIAAKKSGPIRRDFRRADSPRVNPLDGGDQEDNGR